MNNARKEELVLIDGSGYIFRAYYALPPMYRSDGLPVNAVFGFCNMLLKLVEDIQAEKGGNVEIAVIFDAARETFRNEIYPDYKANRSDPPDDLKPQQPCNNIGANDMAITSQNNRMAGMMQVYLKAESNMKNAGMV